MKARQFLLKYFDSIKAMQALLGDFSTHFQWPIVHWPMYSIPWINYLEFAVFGEQ